MNSNTEILERLMKVGRRVLLVGPPGCGKTARIQGLADANGRRLIVMRASLSERVDFGGALVPDMKAGVTRALPLEVLADLKTTTEDTLLFLDDLGQAPMDVQSALMRLFDDGELSPHVLIWGATNRPGDVAGVTRLHEALRSRFQKKFNIAAPGTVDTPASGVVLGTWADEVEGWCDWALDHGAAPEIVAWHRATSGRTLYAWKPSADAAVSFPDYRAWEAVMHDFADGLTDMATISASIGKPAAAEFLAFARLADKLPTPDQVWMDPMGAPVPDDSSALYLAASMLAAAAEAKHAKPLVQYLSRMPRVYGALLARDAFRKLGPKLSGTKEWAEWFVKNQDIFTS